MPRSLSGVRSGEFDTIEVTEKMTAQDLETQGKITAQDLTHSLLFLRFLFLSLKTPMSVE